MWLTPEQRRKLIIAVRQGNSLAIAAKLARLPVRRVQILYNDGRLLAETDDYDPNSEEFEPEEHAAVQFYYDIAEQEAVCQNALMTELADHAKTDWHAGERLLRHHNKEEWEPTKQLNVTATNINTNTSNVKMDLSLLSVEELEFMEVMLTKIANVSNTKEVAAPQGGDMMLSDTRSDAYERGIIEIVEEID